MKKLLLPLLICVSGLAFASEKSVTISREFLGSGQQEITGFENATNWDNYIYHAPQYMPGYPTAAIIYPRVITVKCNRVIWGTACEGYTWLPEMGRGEYLMFQPVIQDVKPQPAPEVKPVTIIREVLVEVPVKKKKE